MITTEPAGADKVTGVFTLILYRSGIETVAFLDKEEDRYTLEPYAPAFDYSVIKGLSGEDALARAEELVKSHSSFSGSRLSGIVDESGYVLGFELRPLYPPLTYGSADILDIYYRGKERKVMIHISLIPSVRTMLSS
ncbi:MAG TPA: hypothetical protein VF790_05695 [Dissulfurispiraceae bacterium]